MVESARDFAIDEVTEWANKINDADNILEIMGVFLFILIPKKEGAVKYGKNRTISIISEVANIVLNVIDEILKKMKKP